MLKRISVLGMMLLALSAYSQREVVDKCDRDEAKDKCRKAITPFRYANMSTTTITFRRFNQVKEVSVPLYYDSKYRFVFNTEGLPQDIKIEIYDRHSTDRKREKIAEFSSSEGTFTFEPEENAYETIYINYLIPASTSEDLRTVYKGCVVMMGGFENVLNFSGDNGESSSTQ